MTISSEQSLERDRSRLLEADVRAFEAIFTILRLPPLSRLANLFSFEIKYILAYYLQKQ
jgi:hypothetical protein